MTGGPSVGRGQQSAIFDSFGQQMLLFGGIDDSLNVLSELWALDLRKDPIAPTSPATSAWSAPANPSAPSLYGHSAVFDTAHRRMIVFGGWDAGFAPTNDVYVLDLSVGLPYTWTKLVASGPTPTLTGIAPAPRAYHTAVYDSANQQMIVYGGNDGAGELSDVRVLSLPTSFPFAWSTPVVPPGPIARSQQASIMDPLRSRMAVFGGEDNDATIDGSTLSNETWAFDPGTMTWTPFFFSGTPSFRSGHSAVYDAANQRMVTLGGTIATSPSVSLTNELWGLRLDATTSWSILDTGTGPAARYGHSAVYDSVFNRMIIFGGFDKNSLTINDLWVVKL